MTFNYKNVYLEDTSTIAGVYEEAGPLNKYYDKCYKDFYFNEKTFELEEIKLMYESVQILLDKSNKKLTDKTWLASYKHDG